VRMVVSELRGEKIDIIPYNDEPARFVAKALSPARVREVLVDDDARQATVVVPDDQLSLAIGREGQNARLAARLTGWRIDIKSETEFATEEPDGDYPEEETGGRCAAILGNGRRCPNAALPGSRFCGLDSHQALEGTGTVYVAGAPPEELADTQPLDEEAEGRSLTEAGTGENGAVDEAVAEEALAEGVPSADGNDGLVEEALADTQPLAEAADGRSLTEAGTGESLAPGDPVAESEAALEPAPEAAEPAALAADEAVEGEEPS
jgi:N utilization substance protein A